MNPSNRSLRTILRWSHVVAGALLAAFVYSPLRESDAFVLLVQVALIPVLILSGFWMSQKARVRKLFADVHIGKATRKGEANVRKNVHEA